MRLYDFNKTYVLQRTRQVERVERLSYDDGELMTTSVESEVNYDGDQIYHIVDKTAKHSPFVMDNVSQQLGFDKDEISSIVARYNQKGYLFADGQSFVTNDLFETNNDYQARDLIIFGGLAPYQTIARIASFGGSKDEKHNVTLQELRQLIDGNHVDLYDETNGRPSVNMLLDFMEKYPSFQLTGSVTTGDIIFDGILSHTTPEPDTQAEIDFKNLGHEFEHYMKPDLAYVLFE